MTTWLGFRQTIMTSRSYDVTINFSLFQSYFKLIFAFF